MSSYAVRPPSSSSGGGARTSTSDGRRYPPRRGSRRLVNTLGHHSPTRRRSLSQLELVRTPAMLGTVNRVSSSARSFAAFVVPVDDPALSSSRPTAHRPFEHSLKIALRSRCEPRLRVATCTSSPSATPYHGERSGPVGVRRAASEPTCSTRSVPGSALALFRTRAASTPAIEMVAAHASSSRAVDRRADGPVLGLA